MEATLYGSWEKKVFNSKDIMYIVEDGFECITHFSNGKIISLSWEDMRRILEKLPKVLWYDAYNPVYINVKEVFTCSIKGLYVNVEFRNGKKLKNLSRTDFDKNIAPILQQEIDLEKNS